MLPDWALILIGLTTLVASAEALVRGAVWIALVAGVEKMIVGLTLVAFGTSAPELSACIVATLADTPGFATGTVIGSNIANIGLIVGLTALYRRIPHESGTARFEVRFLLLVSLLLLLFLALDGISRPAGIALLGLIGTFTGVLVFRTRRALRRLRAQPRAEDRPPFTALGAVVHGALILIGLVGLKFGGEWLVDGSHSVALKAGMSDQVAGQLIVGVGTSLPELATCLVAARRNHPEIALGNVLGSNVFNICMVFGVTATVRPLPLQWAEEGLAVAVMLVLTMALALMLRRRLGVTRPSGALLFAAYTGYVVWLTAGLR